MGELIIAILLYNRQTVRVLCPILHSLF